MKALYALLAFTLLFVQQARAAGGGLAASATSVRSSEGITEGETREVHIAFGETLEASLEKMEQGTTWTITGPASAGALVVGSGDDLRRFVFNSPGTYSVGVQAASHVPGACEHAQVFDRVVVHVSPVRMTFNLEGVRLSEPIRSGQPTEHIKLQVPVEVAVYDGSVAEIELADVRTAGVGTSVVAHSNSAKLSLASGPHVLEYGLTGKVDGEAYIMFDLVDNIGRVIGYSLMEKIQ